MKNELKPESSQGQRRMVVQKRINKSGYMEEEFAKANKLAEERNAIAKQNLEVKQQGLQALKDLIASLNRNEQM